MLVVRYTTPDLDPPRIGALDAAAGVIRPLAIPTLADLLEQPDPGRVARGAEDGAPIARENVRLLAPIEHQEVWAAGVTYRRSREARREESTSGADFYDRVYTAERPELFFKATPHRVAGPDDTVRIREDATWNVPEPELALVVNSRGRWVGVTLGNDMSSRDIEGENPLYLPQAKVYDRGCGLGPGILLIDGDPGLSGWTIDLAIERAGRTEFAGTAALSDLVRTPEELIGWLRRDQRFPDGVILLTGTGVVPPNEFTLRPGDEITISCAPIGVLRQTVVQGSAK